MFTVPVLVQLVVAVGLVGYLSLHNGEQAMQNLASQLRTEISARIEGELASYFGDPHALNRLNATAFSSGDLDIRNAAYGEPLLSQQMKIYPNIALVYCGSARSGEFFGVLRSPDTGELEFSYSNRSNDFFRDYYTLDVRGYRQHFIRRAEERYDARLRPWFRAAITAEQPAWTDVYLAFTTGLPNITASLPVYDNRQGRQLLGVCAADVVLPEEFRAFLSQLHIGQSGHAFVVDRRGNLIASSTDEPLLLKVEGKGQFLQAINSTDPLVQQSAAYLLGQFGQFDRIQRSQQLAFPLKGQRHFLEVLPFSDGFGLDWLIVVVVPEADIMGQIYTNTRITILLCAIALVIALGVGIASTRRMTEPILKLNQAVKEIARGNWDQPLPSARTDEVGQLARSVDSMAMDLRQSFGRLEAQKNAFARFFPPEYLALFQKRDVTEVQLGDYISQTMTVMFADIRQFTGLVERMSPGALAEFMNNYLQRISPEIRGHRGIVVKFIGDSIMAVFPEAVEDGIAAALAQFDQVRAYNTEGIGPGHIPVKIGIGLHTGPMMLGIIGEPTRMQGDALSDTVNLAARLEGLSKVYSAPLVISEEVFNQLSDPQRFPLRFLDRVMVKGRRGSLDIYEVLGAEEPDLRSRKLASLEEFATGVQCYRDRDWTGARHCFNRVLQINPEDGAAQIYMDRLEILMTEGVPPDWDGVWVFKQKR
ncbi:cache domain-containing protein [Leptolyngbya sp. PCC 6406]|uniref:cache domain-containing protein n=1 Tax=Leptolyngbya sp. PCC 6406 TaxID=1173264 RepID=UPI0002AB99F6|nr:cache domain-containing protein [Leptolyngbya sp. PCC 6406]